MSICDFYPIDEHSSTTCTEKRTNVILQDELFWGRSYRHYRKIEKQVPIPPKKSPIDIPFKICRERQRQELIRCACRKYSKSKLEKKPTLLEKSVMTQNQYMEYLSTPRKIKKPTKKKRKRRCEIEPCPPRFVQLAVPKKRRVFENWKTYHEMLPTEVIVRFEQILHTDKNLDPREARYYYKKLDKSRKRELKEKRKIKKQKEAEKEKGDKAWLKKQIQLTTEAIIDYLKEEPLFTLNYRQVMLSDSILDMLDKINLLKKPSRKSKSHCKKVIVELSDKCAVWIDTLIRFVDVQAIDSEEDIPPVSISSMEEEGEEEEEEEEEESEEEAEGLSELGEELLAEMEKLGFEGEEEEQFMVLQERGWTEGEEELKEGEFIDFAVLTDLIKLLETSAEDQLNSLPDESYMPNVRYQDILDQLKAIRPEQSIKDIDMTTLADIISAWAKLLDAEKVDERMEKEIVTAAKILGEWWKEEAEQGLEFGGAEEAEEEMEGGLAGMEGLETGLAEEAEEELGGGLAEEAEEGLEGGLTGAEEEMEGGIVVFPGEGEEGLEGGLAEGAEEGLEGEISGIAEEEGGLGEETEEGLGGGLAEEEGGEGKEGEAEESEVGKLELEGEEGLETALIQEMEKWELTESGIEMMEIMKEEGEREEELITMEAETPVIGEEQKIAVTEEKEKVFEVIFEPAKKEGEMIKGHKPPKVYEHSVNMVCCLSIKIWAVWLLEITHNGHNWTKWIHGVINKIKEFASIVRGDVIGPDGKPKVLYKKEWRKFCKEMEEMIISWRQYSKHVKEISTSIIDNFHNKEVKCCPKCLEDNLIKDVLTAHETLAALTEGMQAADHWRKILDELVSKTGVLTDIVGLEEEEVKSEESSDEETPAYLEELSSESDEEDESLIEF